METAERLDRAVTELSQRGLVQAAKWASEALVSMEVAFTRAQPAALDQRTVMAKIYFDCHEYDRCWHYLRGTEDAVGRFLRLYARYIVGEKEKENACDSLFGTQGIAMQNPYLPEILEEILGTVGYREDSYMMYLLGVVFRHQKQARRAKEALVASVTLQPCNWSAWKELLQCVKNLKDMTELFSELTHIDAPAMLELFKIYVYQEFYQPESSVSGELAQMKKLFPKWVFLEVQCALMNVHDLNYDVAEKAFEKILNEDPYRLEELDLYSNVLYITEQRAKLSYIAQLAAKTDKYRAESCCVVANYYSLQGEHEKAVSYYQRALISNRSYLPAWTLLGHEFVELKNTHAAIESYRAAVSINRRDYRAWYGLGQAYEVLDMINYSQYYFKQALALRPNDTRVWGALANSYERLQEYDLAISAYQQVLHIMAGDSYTCFKLGILFEQKNDLVQAANYMRICVEAEDEYEVVWLGQARMWLARQALKEGNWADAHEHALTVSEASEYGAVLEEEARAIIRDATNRLRADAHSSSGFQL